MIAEEIERKFRALLPRALEVLIEARCCADAIEAANDVDRAWFEQHPDRRLYLRAPVPDELFAMSRTSGVNVRENDVILVGSLDEGVYVRVPLRAPPDVDLDKVSEENMLLMLEGWPGDNETNKRIAQQLRARVRAAVPFKERLARRAVRQR